MTKTLSTILLTFMSFVALINAAEGELDGNEEIGAGSAQTGNVAPLGGAEEEISDYESADESDSSSEDEEERERKALALAWEGSMDKKVLNCALTGNPNANLYPNPYGSH